MKNIKVVHDSSVLPQERKDYLAGAVDITQFVKNTEALSDCVHFYLQELEWKDMQIETNEQMLDEKIINFAFESIAKNESTWKLFIYMIKRNFHIWIFVYIC